MKRRAGLAALVVWACPATAQEPSVAVDPNALPLASGNNGAEAVWHQPIVVALAVVTALLALMTVVVLARKVRRSEDRRLLNAEALRQRQIEFAALKRIIQATEDMTRPLEEIIARAAKILPQGFTYPEDLEVCIAVDDCVVDHMTSRGIAAQMDVPVIANGKQRGMISVAYRSAHDEIEEGPFWTNERTLVEIVSHRIANTAGRKAAETLLQFTEDKYEAIFRNAATPAALDDGLRFIDVNVAAMRSFGISSAAEMIGKSPADFSPEFQPDGRRSADEIPQVIAQLRKDGIARFDWTFRKVDGSLFLADITLSSVSFGDTFVTLSSWTDVTDLRKAEATLARYNETLAEDVARRTADLAKVNSEFAAILTSATSGIALVRHMKVVRSNPALARMFRTPGDLIDGQPLGEWCEDEKTWAACSAMADKALWSGDIFSVDHELRRHDGTTFWARLSARAIEHTRPELGSVWMVEDISVERAARAEIQKARLMAEEAAAVKSRFLANMSHEIRTPMNAIIGFASLLKETDLSSRQRGYLDRITAAGENLLGIINDILDFSKVEAGKIRIEMIDLSLRDVVHGAVDMVLSRATEKKLDVIVDIDPLLPDVYRGDPLRIGQILVNLLSNAVKFTDKGEIHIGVEGQPQDDGIWALVFDVSDTGIGMSPEQMAGLFQSFSQADASTTRVFGGTGLGLAISKSLAELMGGTITVQSAPAKGTTFCLDLNLSSVGPWRGPGQDLREKSFVVVDGNPRSAKALVRDLRSRGADVAQPDSLAGARDLVVARTSPNEKVTAVLVACPIGEERDALDAIAAQERLVLMAYPDEEADIDPDVRHVATDVVHKPVDAERVLSLLKNWQDLTADAAPEPAGKTGVQTLSGCDVLLVEDNRFNQELATELLQRMGARVTLASNGAEAVEAVGRSHFDIVLMDLQMPVMGGLDATRAIRALDGPVAQVPVIALTASMEPDVETTAYRAGMNGMIIKPFAPQVLEAAILEHVARPATHSAGIQGEAPSDTPASVTMPEGLAALEHVDAQRGLALAGGSLPLYHKLLSRFVEAFAGFGETCSAAGIAADPATAERAAHTLKSSSAQVGAIELSRAAGLLEGALQKGDAPAAQERLPEVLSHLHEVVSELGRLVADAKTASGPVPSSGPVAANANFEDAAARMAALLEKGEFEAVALLETQGAVLSSGFKPDAWTAFSRAIEGLDFTGANLLLRKAMEMQREGST